MAIAGERGGRVGRGVELDPPTASTDGTIHGLIEDGAQEAPTARSGVVGPA